MSMTITSPDTRVSITQELKKTGAALFFLAVFEQGVVQIRPLGNHHAGDGAADEGLALGHNFPLVLELVFVTIPP
jgi:hypothetical protein